MKIVNSQAMSMIDKRAQDEYRMPSLLLMENAGIKACNLLKEKVFKHSGLPGKAVFVAGKGNNGGDVLVMARQYYLQGERELTILLAAGDPFAESESGINLAICRKLGIPVVCYTQDPQAAAVLIRQAAWMFDGIAGTGIRGELNGVLKELITEMNRAPGKIIAIDVPSGLGDEFKQTYICVQAHYTLTMGLPKKCLYLPAGRIRCGEIHVVSLGFPPKLIRNPAIPGELLQEEDLWMLNPPVPTAAYKNTRGHLAVFAGSPGTTGAAWLSCTAASHSKVGLVTYFADSEIYPLVAAEYRAVMVQRWVPGEAIAKLTKYSAFLIGPGWGLDKNRRNWLECLLGLEQPCLIDADGLTLLARLAAEKSVNLGNRCVLTPHLGEFSRLCGVPSDMVEENPVHHARELSARFNAVIVLKGHITFIATPQGEYSILDGMNPALATAGSGDVLSGIIAALLALGMTPYEAARLGVLVHSLAGNQAFATGGWFTAEDLIPFISRILTAGQSPNAL